MGYTRYNDLEAKHGIRISRRQLKRRQELGTFPLPMQLGPNTLAWDDDDLIAWKAARKAERDARAAELQSSLLQDEAA